jgi:hypothetical protein
LNKLVKSDTVLRYHKAALFKRWHFTRKVQSSKAAGSIYEQIKMRLEAQNRWVGQLTPSGYILPTAGDKIATILCEKNRLLVVSVTDAKNTKISMYDLETLQLLATTETNQFRGSTNATKILWKGGDWVLFVPTSDVLYAWNSAENSLNQVTLEKGKHSHIHFKLLAFNGLETILYVTSLDYLAAEEDDRFERYVYNLNTKETRKIDWITSKGVPLGVNWTRRCLVYQKEDGKYYMEKFDADWNRTSSVVLDIMDCYGNIIFAITSDYIFVVYASESTAPRVFSAITGAMIMRLPFSMIPSLQKLQCSKDGMLTLEYQHSKAVVGAYTLKNNRLDQLQWITKSAGEKSVLKIFTPELALIKYGKSISFQTPNKKTDIVSGGKLTAAYARLIPAEYEKWTILNNVLSETQIIFQMQSQNTKQTAVIVFDYCRSVVQ